MLEGNLQPVLPYVAAHQLLTVLCTCRVVVECFGVRWYLYSLTKIDNAYKTVTSFAVQVFLLVVMHLLAVTEDLTTKKSVGHLIEFEGCLFIDLLYLSSFANVFFSYNA